MGCSEGLARIILFVINFACVLVGLALLVVGILCQVQFKKFTDVIPSEAGVLNYVPILAIVLGVIIFVIAFLGCCGTLKSNTCMLSWFGGILVVIFLLQVGLGIYAFVEIKNTSNLKNEINNALTKLFSQYHQNTVTQETVDLIQSTFQCCGTTSSSSWGNNIPASCYPNSDQTKSIFGSGCSSVVPDKILSSIETIAIVAVSISAVEVIGAVLAFCLVGCIRESRSRTHF